MAAAKQTLEALHDKLATTLAEIIESGEIVKNADGEAVKVTPSASILSVARQFLKDNHIEAQAVPGSPLGKLAGVQMPFPSAASEDAAEERFEH